MKEAVVGPVQLADSAEVEHKHPEALADHWH